MIFTDYIKKRLLAGFGKPDNNPFINSKDGLRCRYDSIKIEIVDGTVRATFSFHGKDIFWREFGPTGRGDVISISNLDGSVGFILS